MSPRALAQDLTGYQAGNLYVTKYALDEINTQPLIRGKLAVLG